MNGAVAFLNRLEQAAELIRLRSAVGEMAWRSWGDGPPLVLLHGASGSWRHWARNIDRLAASHRLLVPDLPGMGDSEAPERAIGRHELGGAMAEALDGLLRGVAFDLVGFSFSGPVAGMVAGLLPERVRSLTLVGAGGFGPPLSDPPMVRLSGLQGAERTAAHRRNLLSLMIADPARLDALALEIQEQNTTRRRAKLRGDRGTAFLPGVLGPYRGPLHAVWGERDQFAGEMLPERIDRLARARPDAEIYLFPGAGHWVAYEAAEAFDEYLLSRIRRGS